MSAGKYRVSVSPRTRQLASGLLTLGAAMVGLFVAIASFGLDKVIRPELASYGTSAYQAGQITVITEKLAELHVEQQQIKKALARPSASTDLNILAQRFEQIERRQSRLERAIMDSPEKALEVPMLRNDLSNLKDINAQNLAAIKSTVDQVYDLNKWLLGAMAPAIVGLAVTRLLSAKSE